MSESEIYYSKSSNTTLNFSSSELKIKEASQDSGYGVRVLNNGKIGFSYAQNENQLDEAKKNAEKVSKFSPKTNFSFPKKSSFPNLDLYDENTANSEIDTLRDLLKQIRTDSEVFGGHSRIILDCGSELVRIENSEGFFGEYKKSSFSAYVEVMHADGFGFGFINQLKMPKTTDIGLLAADMARNLMGATKPPSGKYTIVLELEAFDNLLEVLLPSFSGEWLRRGISKINKETKFSELLTLSDDGSVIASNSAPFDDEGVASKKRTLIDCGKVSSFIYDNETASLANLSAEGFCKRSSYSSPPSLGHSNIVISGGEFDNFSELNNYIEIHSMHGSHTANTTTGDAGFEVSSGFLVQNGERKPVRGFLLSCNVFNLFSNILGIEKKQKTFGNLISPRIAFSDVDVVS